MITPLGGVDLAVKGVSAQTEQELARLSSSMFDLGTVHQSLFPGQCARPLVKRLVGKAPLGQGSVHQHPDHPARRPWSRPVGHHPPHSAHRPLVLGDFFRRLGRAVFLRCLGRCYGAQQDRRAEGGRLGGVVDLHRHRDRRPILRTVKGTGHRRCADLQDVADPAIADDGGYFCQSQTFLTGQAR